MREREREKIDYIKFQNLKTIALLPKEEKRRLQFYLLIIFAGNFSLNLYYIVYLNTFILD